MGAFLVTLALLIATLGALVAFHSHVPAGVNIALLFLGFFLVCAVGVQRTRWQGYRMLRQPPFERPPPPGPRAVELRGHAVVGLWPMPWPFSRLIIDVDWTTIRGGGVPALGINRAVVTKVRQVGAPGFRGVHFDSIDGRYDGVLFSPPLRTAQGTATILASFSELGWPT